ncbi:MAG: S8 family serine peptidase [Lysobacteraceae bacterium]
MVLLQRKWCSIAVSAALVSMVSAAAAAPGKWDAGTAVAPSPVLQAYAEQGRMPYIIGFREMPAVTYAAKLDGASKAPLAAMSDDEAEASVAAYVDTLAKTQRGTEARLKASVKRDFAVQHRMQHAFNGIVAVLSPAEAAALAADPAVTLVEPYSEALLDDDVAPAVVGAPTVWSNGTGIHRAAFINRERTGVSLFNRRAKGEGVIVGVIDSGINQRSPSFAGVDPVTGYEFTNPFGEGTYLGQCRTGGVDAGRCNGKLVGGYDFVYNAVCTPNAPTTDPCRPGGTWREDPSFGDTDGHGSHTAGTSAGNSRLVSFRGNTLELSGMAPRANVISYDACYTVIATGVGPCPNVATLAAINQAVADGVDVINYSIGGGIQPWSEAISQAFLAAADAGIFIAASAGNSGPGPSTNGHNEPWVMTVAAAQSGRAGYEFSLNVSGSTVPSNLQRILLNAGSGGVELTTSIPSSSLRAGPNFAGAADGCTSTGGFSAGSFSNRIALVRRGTCPFTEKVTNAVAAGARAVIIVNNTTGGIAPSVPGATVPVFGMAQTEGVALQGLTATDTTVAGSIPAAAALVANTQDQLAGFSSRGPAPFSVLKPDITGHGVNILEPLTCADPTQWNTSTCANTIGLLSGTSMSSPQVAGAGALLKQIFPDWSPAEIKSALMMTARQTVLLEDGVTAATPFAAGAGRLQVDLAAKAGLVLDEQRADYLAANPATGGDPSALNLASLANRGCSGTTCTFTRTFRSTRATFQTFSASLSGVTGTISTPIFTVAPFGTASITVTVNTSGQPSDGSYRFGALTLTSTGNDAASRSPTLRLPVAVAVRAPELSLSTQSIAITAPANATRTASFGVWSSNSNPVDFTAAATGTGQGALVAQSSLGATSGYSAGLFTDFGIGLYAADDFVLATSSTLTSIANEGFVLGTGVIPSTAGIRGAIFPDAGGVPAGNPETSPNAAVWRFSTPANGPGVSTAGGVLRLNLAAAGQSVTLPPGRYWMVPQVNTLFANRFAWFFSQEGNGTSPRTTQPSLAPPNNGWNVPTNPPAGLAYTINGTVGCGAPWLSGLAPTSGRAAAGSPASVGFTVNTAGLAPGNYTGFVCIGSNDPSRPQASVRVNLTVTP